MFVCVCVCLRTSGDDLLYYKASLPLLPPAPPQYTHPHPHSPSLRFPYDDTRTIGPPLRAKAGPFYDPRVGRYAFRFPGSDSAVVKATQRMVSNSLTVCVRFLLWCMDSCTLSSLMCWSAPPLNTLLFIQPAHPQRPGPLRFLPPALRRLLHCSLRFLGRHRHPRRRRLHLPGQEGVGPAAAPTPPEALYTGSFFA